MDECTSGCLAKRSFVVEWLEAACNDASFLLGERASFKAGRVIVAADECKGAGHSHDVFARAFDIGDKKMTKKMP